jgi:hypothetical protein
MDDYEKMMLRRRKPHLCETMHLTDEMIDDLRQAGLVTADVIALIQVLSDTVLCCRLNSIMQAVYGRCKVVNLGRDRFSKVKTNFSHLTGQIQNIHQSGHRIWSIRFRLKGSCSYLLMISHDIDRLQLFPLLYKMQAVAYITDILCRHTYLLSVSDISRRNET